MRKDPMREHGPLVARLEECLFGEDRSRVVIEPTGAVQGSRSTEIAIYPVSGSGYVVVTSADLEDDFAATATWVGNALGLGKETP